MQSGNYLLEMRDIHKSFGAVRAVQYVDLVLQRGEILGLLGDNAAGKSTLMKILTAFHTPDRGKIYMDGQEVHIATPGDARRLGIEMIYQDFSLAPNLSIADNIFLGRELSKTFLGMHFIDRKRMEEKAKEAMSVTNIRLDSVKTIVTDLSGGQRQAVAIARATAFDAKIIIMDEPTASLSVKTIPPLLDLMVQLRDRGLSMVFITHRIQDVFSTCDRVMVLRRGKCVGVAYTRDTTVDEVTSLIAGTQRTFEKNAAHFNPAGLEDYDA
jgi:ABC-type sugar transport system ATPase subunit